MTRNERALAHDLLTAGWPREKRARIEFYEAVLCTIFRKQFVLGSEPCLALRSTLVDMWTEASNGRGEDA